MYEWDRDKNAENSAKHGVDFAEAEGFEWDTALTVSDVRRRYAESRNVSFGFIGSRLYALVWTPRGSIVRVISLRKANRREIKRYVDRS
ncbi:MAG: BrnT family toxin [Alphaproteobacteria bacterium]|nr:BrnT family toxin [Alphaproteobacteria bacterium]